MAEIQLRAQPLTREGFLPFGEVIETHSAGEVRTINNGNAERFHNLGNLQAEESKCPLVNFFRPNPIRFPLQIKLMERHPRYNQLFFPLDPEPYLVVVANPGDFQIATLRAFVAGPKQGVNYRAGTWHHPLLALNKICDFLVLDRNDLPDNCDVIRVTESVVVDLPETRA